VVGLKGLGASEEDVVAIADYSRVLSDHKKSAYCAYSAACWTSIPMDAGHRFQPMVDNKVNS